MPTAPEPEPETLSAEADACEHGTDFFSELPPGMTEAKARRMARAIWWEQWSGAGDTLGPRTRARILGMGTLGRA
jgi:hypothetical protein